MKRLCSSILALAAVQVSAFAQNPELAEPMTILYREPSPLYSRRHFYLGAEAIGAVVLNETGSHSFYTHGGGFNVFVGGRIHKYLALELGWSPTFHGQPSSDFGQAVSSGIALSAITTDLKIFFVRGRVQPYALVGPAAFIEHDWSFHYFGAGPGLSAGGGIDFYVFQGLGFGLKAEYRGAQLYNYDGFNDHTWLSMLDFGGSITGHF